MNNLEFSDEKTVNGCYGNSLIIKKAGCSYSLININGLWLSSEVVQDGLQLNILGTKYLYTLVHISL